MTEKYYDAIIKAAGRTAEVIERMLFTAHSGANGTQPNAIDYFEAMKRVNADVIEADIRKVKGELLLTHDKVRFWQRKKPLPLSYAFDFIKEYDFLINCDLKEDGLVPDLMALAERHNVQDRIIITGSAGTEADRKAILFGDWYVNADYLPKLLPQNVSKIKSVLLSFGPHAKGINVSYKKLPDEFLTACEKEKVPVSIFTVNDAKLIKKYAAFPAVVNITTQLADEGLSALGREVRK